jgi:hypothetical protein
LRLPFHVIVNVADAPVADFVTQLRGLVANDPFILPFSIVTVLSVVLQPDRLPFTVDSLVPPPEFVSAGENDTLADTEQVTEPGAVPENLGGRGVWAATGEATANVTTNADNMAANPDNRVAHDA